MQPPTTSTTRGKLRSVFATSFILTISIALTSYIDSSFIETFIKKSQVGLLFTLGSLGAIAFIINAPRVFERFGVLNTFRFGSTMYVLAIAGMVFLPFPALAQISFLIYWISVAIMFLSIDVLIQHYSEKNVTGGTRGFYLTVYNLAFLVSPFIAGILADKAGFHGVYLVSGAFIAIMSYFFIHRFKGLLLFPKRNGFRFVTNFLSLLRDKDLRGVYLVALSMNFFFAWMTIYMPIYLHMNVGLSWPEIGAIFAIMHIPYILLEIPWGKIADTILGEKEIMGAGIVIIGLCTIAIGFITSAEFWVWASALSLTRIGASMVQVTTESYFFKKIDKEDTSKIAVFRNASPIAFLVAPLIGTAALLLANFSQLFIILGVIVLLALIPNHSMSDTR